MIMTIQTSIYVVSTSAPVSMITKPSSTISSHVMPKSKKQQRNPFFQHFYHHLGQSDQPSRCHACLFCTVRNEFGTCGSGCNEQNWTIANSCFYLSLAERFMSHARSFCEDHTVGYYFQSQNNNNRSSKRSHPKGVCTNNPESMKNERL